MNKVAFDHGAIVDFKRAVVDIARHLRLRLKLQHVSHVKGPRDFARNHQVSRVYFPNDVPEFADDDHADFAVDAVDIALNGTVDAESTRIRQRASIVVPDPTSVPIVFGILPFVPNIAPPTSQMSAAHVFPRPRCSSPVSSGRSRPMAAR